MVTKDQIDRFYKDVELLGLKFPVAELERATGESKGNISKYLKKKAEPSEGFLKKFYKSFEKVIKEKREKTGVDITIDRDKLIIEMLKEIIKLNARADVLSITLADIVSKVDKKAIATADSELIDAMNRRNEALLEEWKKKFPLLN